MVKIHFSFYVCAAWNGMSVTALICITTICQLTWKLWWHEKWFYLILSVLEDWDLFPILGQVLCPGLQDEAGAKAGPRVGWGSRGRDGHWSSHHRPAVWAGCCAAETMGFLDVDITDQTGLNFCHKKHPMLLLGVATMASTIFSS